MFIMSNLFSVTNITDLHDVFHILNKKMLEHENIDHHEYTKTILLIYNFFDIMECNIYIGRITIS